MKQFGARVTKKLKERYARSPHWTGNKFQNLEETSMNISFENIPKLLYQQLCESKGREPESPLEVLSFPGPDFLKKSSAFIWYGHSSLLLRLNDKTILIDPMMGPDASPIAPFSTRRFSENTLDIIDDIPPVDLLLLSHDHYDHLDLSSMRKLAGKTGTYFTSLGSGRHLNYWNMAHDNLREFDWWDTKDFEGIRITFTPSRHFSGRGLTDRSKSLWGGWVIETSECKLFFSGDGGYGAHFAEIGEKLGPFDVGFMECGQYNEHWHQIHMYPEESVKAAIDAKVRCAMPVHWGAFSLAQHSWKEPAERFVKEAKKQSLPFLTPRLGQLSGMDDSSGEWWIDHS